MSDGILLKGLDGSNPLAFLAAIGALRTLTIDKEHTRLTWLIHEGKWTPLLIAVDVAPARLPQLLFEQLGKELGKPWNIDKRLPFEASRLRALALELAGCAASSGRDPADILAALGSEVFLDAKGLFEDTAFRMVRSGDSAGQGFLDYACRIAQNTAAEDLTCCLFERWEYCDRGSSLRWDPAENREYALLASNPSKDGALSVIGANRLALEALPLFPTMPGLGGLVTTGFLQSRVQRGMEFRWPIWDGAISLSTIRSLLTHPALFSDPFDPSILKAIGVRSVFVARRIKPNQYYCNFAPARAL